MNEQQAAVPKRWVLARLGDVAHVIRGVTYKKDQASSEPDEDRVPLLRSGNVQNRLTFDKPVYVPSQLVKPEQFLRVGDVVVSTSNSRELVGKAAQLTAPWRGTFGAFCTVVRPSELLNARLIGLFLQSPEYRAVIWGHAAAVNNIANIRVGHLEEMLLPLPPREEQDRVVSVAEDLLVRIEVARDDLAHALAGYAVLRESILHQLFRGGIGGCSPADSSAEELLDAAKGDVERSRPTRRRRRSSASGGKQ